MIDKEDLMSHSNADALPFHPGNDEHDGETSRRPKGPGVGEQIDPNEHGYVLYRVRYTTEAGSAQFGVDTQIAAVSGDPIPDAHAGMYCQDTEHWQLGAGFFDDIVNASEVRFDPTVLDWDPNVPPFVGVIDHRMPVSTAWGDARPSLEQAFMRQAVGAGEVWVGFWFEVNGDTRCFTWFKVFPRGKEPPGGYVVTKEESATFARKKLSDFPSDQWCWRSVTFRFPPDRPTDRL
jgi:hypothetical protein